MDLPAPPPSRADELLTPAARPVASDERFLDLRQEVDKLGALTDSPVDWRLVADLGAALTRDVGKDLGVVAYTAFARYKLRDLPGLHAAVVALARLLRAPPTTLTPTKPRPRGASLEWLLTRLQHALPALAPTPADAANLADLEAALRDLHAASQDVLGDMSPRFSPTLQAITALRADLPPPPEAPPRADLPAATPAPEAPPRAPLPDATPAPQEAPPPTTPARDEPAALPAPNAPVPPAAAPPGPDRAALAAWLAPLAVSPPCGPDPAGHDLFDAARQQLARLSAVTGDPVDWPRVEAHSDELLRTRARDLRPATWLALARARRRDLHGSATAIHLISTLLGEFPEAVHPRKPKSRRDTLDWFFKNFATALLDTPTPTLRPADLDALDTARRTLAETLDTHLPDPPSLRPLRDALQQLRDRLPDPPPNQSPTNLSTHSNLATQPPTNFSTQSPNPANTSPQSTHPSNLSAQSTHPANPPHQSSPSANPASPATLSPSNLPPQSAHPTAASNLSPQTAHPTSPANPSPQSSNSTTAANLSPSANPASPTTLPPQSAHPTAAANLSQQSANPASPTALAPQSTHPTTLPPSPAQPAAPLHFIKATAVAAPASSAELDRFLTATSDALCDAARALRESSSSDPRAYRLLRTGLWIHLTAPPPVRPDGNTGIPGLDDRDRTTLAELAAAARWPALLTRCENLLVRHRLALDLQRLSSAALTALGPDHADAALAVRAELRALLTRLPALPDLRDRDGQPLADPATRKWLADTVLPTTSHGPSDDPTFWTDLAPRLRGPGRPAALADAQAHLDAAPSGQRRLLRRLALAETLLASDDPALAHILFTALADDLHHARTDTWDPPLAARCLAAAARCPPPTTPPSPTLLRLARLDITAAAELLPPR